MDRHECVCAVVEEKCGELSDAVPSKGDPSLVQQQRQYGEEDDKEVLRTLRHVWELIGLRMDRQWLVWKDRIDVDEINEALVAVPCSPVLERPV